MTEHGEESDEGMIYVPVLVEGETLWRPAPAEPVGIGLYRLERPEDYDPEYENWVFEPGDTVRCEVKRLEDGDYLTAVERAMPV